MDFRTGLRQRREQTTQPDLPADLGHVGSGSHVQWPRRSRAGQDPGASLVLTGSGPLVTGASAGATPKTGKFALGPLALAILVAVVIGSVFWIGVWATETVHAEGDTFQYARMALVFAGRTPEEARAEAASFTVDVTGTGSADLHVNFDRSIDPRYTGIFWARPMYSASAALLIPLVGLNAMVVSAFLAGVMVAVALGAFVWSVTRSLAASATSAALPFVLPTGPVIALLYADGWMLAWWTAALACASLYLIEGSRRWLVPFLIAAVLLWATKSANAAVLAVACTISVGPALLLRHEQVIRILRLAAIAAGVSTVGYLAAAAFGLPGLLDTLQDFFTAHFASPDVPDPIGRLLESDRRSLPRWAVALAKTPTLWLPFVVATVALLRNAAFWPVLWLSAAAATTLVVLIHPAPTQLVRLMAPAWITCALGIALGVAQFERLVRNRLQKASSVALDSFPPDSRGKGRGAVG
jgi:hypothetical protein